MVTSNPNEKQSYRTPHLQVNMAPEMVDGGEYTVAVDWYCRTALHCTTVYCRWALGVLIYGLVLGCAPFQV